jgi:CDP-glucose 4,6-dehydratase
VSGAVPRPQFWRGKRVLVTGHTGFVGGWLSTWLSLLGALVSGFSLAPPTVPSFFEQSMLKRRLTRSLHGDLTDAGAIKEAIGEIRPEIIFHLAAQPLVRMAWREPRETFLANLMGTVNVLDACRGEARPEKLLLYTTDKVYNGADRDPWPETTPLGGLEPYSASKVCAEWAVAAYWESFFRRGQARLALATIRAGNILGGGDWAPDRLLPDAVRAFSAGKTLAIRNPGATRPWQHVLDAVRGTLVLAERLNAADLAAADLGWNFGPDPRVLHTVAEVAEVTARSWGDGAAIEHRPDESIREADRLVLSSEKAERELGWRACWDLERTVDAAVEWYRAARGGADLAALCDRQIDSHIAAAA